MTARIGYLVLLGCSLLWGCSHRTALGHADASFDHSAPDRTLAELGILDGYTDHPRPDLSPDTVLPDLALAPDLGPPPDGGTCTPLTYTTLKHQIFTGKGCYPIPYNQVINSTAQMKTHLAHGCAICKCSGPNFNPCPAAPSIDFSKHTLLYAYGMSAHGCEVVHTVDSVLDCGSHLRVHYSAGGYDKVPLTCEAVVEAYVSALVPKTTLPVYFIRSTWTH